MLGLWLRRRGTAGTKAGTDADGSTTTGLALRRVHAEAVTANGFSLEQDEERLVWIFGSSRSGSTWLLRMLGELDGVTVIDDPHLGHHLGVWRPIPLAWAVGEEAPELTTLLELKRDENDYFFSEQHRESWWQPLRSLIQSRFESMVDVEGPGKPTVIVKEPGSHAAPLLAKLFPQSRLIFLLRDGRDVVDSWLDAYRRGSWAIEGGAFPVSDEGRVPLIRWLSAVWAYRCRAVRAAFDTREPGSRALVRYEDLREATTERLEHICESVGLDCDGLDEIVATHSFEQLPSGARGHGKEQRLASPGAWRHHLTREEQAAMHEVMGSALDEFGYEPEPPLEVARAMPTAATWFPTD